MEKKILKAQIRKILGRKVRQLRNQGFLPGNVFGKRIKSLSLSVKLGEFQKVYKEVGETGLVDLVVERDKGSKDQRSVLISNVQFDPVTDYPIHIDFHQVDLKEKVTAEVAIEMAGESPAEKQGLGTVVLYIDEIEVEALPMDLPEKFVIDISKLEKVDQSILVKDLKVEKDKVVVKADADEIVVKIEPPQKEEVVAPPVEEVPVEGEVPEGEVPAEGVTGEEETPKVEKSQEGERQQASEKQSEGAKQKGSKNT